MKLLLAVLVLAADSANARPRMNDYLPRWKDGQTWKVEYTAAQPSAAAVLDPADETVKAVWEYRAAKEADGSWKLVIKEDTTRMQEHYEVMFTTALTVAKAVMINAWGEPHMVFNDAEGAVFRADTTKIPLLDWPEWKTGKLEGDSFVLRLETTGYNAFTERFVWKKGKPWWVEAERSYGPRGVKARLIP